MRIPLQLRTLFPVYLTYFFNKEAYWWLCSANRRQLTLEEIRDIQMKASKVVLDQYAKQQLQYLNESSTFLDILQLGLVLSENLIITSF